MVKQIELADGVTQWQSPAALVNCTVLEADDELVVVDTLLRPQDTREVAAHIRKLGKPVRWLVNTHWHSDHCYGNRFLAHDRTCVVAHDDHLATLRRERHVLSPGRRNIVEREHLVMPHLTLRQPVCIARPLELRLLPAPGHTPDSIVIYDPARKLLITGDCVLNSGDGAHIAVPYFYWGHSGDYIASLENLLTLDIQTVIPGHGAACGAEVMERGLTYLRNLRRLVAEYMAAHTHDWERYDMENSGILASHCLPGTAEEDFWVPQMHGLNLQRMKNELLGKDIE